MKAIFAVAAIAGTLAAASASASANQMYEAIGCTADGKEIGALMLVAGTPAQDADTQKTLNELMNTIIAGRTITDIAKDDAYVGVRTQRAIDLTKDASLTLGLSDGSDGGDGIYAGDFYQTGNSCTPR